MTKPGTLERYLTANYSNDVLEEFAEDGCNWGGHMTNELYFEYYSDIWRANDSNDKDVSLSTFPDHVSLARYLLSNAVRYYAQLIISAME